MNDAVSVLSGGGFDNADSLVRAATDSGLPLGIAAALVAKESMGANVYGHDAGGAMQGAGEVTRNNYYSGFLPVIQAGGTSNGVGPCQITYPGYFTSDPDYAWWDPYSNMLFGFNLLRGYLNGVYTDSALVAAGSTYNSGSATGSASTYGRTFADLAETWTDRLSSVDTSEDDMDATQADQLDKVFKWIDTANKRNILQMIIDIDTWINTANQINVLGIAIDTLSAVKTLQSGGISDAAIEAALKSAISSVLSDLSEKAK